MALQGNVITTAIILAGGDGTRFGAGVPKQFADVCGKTVLERTVEAFNKCDAINHIVIVTRSQYIEYVRNDLALASDKIYAVVEGGNSRSDSAVKGFESIPESTDFVAIHDAARCMIAPDDIELVLAKAYETGAASAARTIKDTVKTVSSDVILGTVNRDNLLAAETPQIFSVELYKRASAFSDDSITDDNMLFERAEIPVSFVLLNHPNIKITTQSDLEYAEFLINKNSSASDYRVGQGYDVHRLVQGRDLILGGVNIPFEKGLLGHSDADVLVHAIMDSLLGSVGLGDIGRHFPDSDEKYRGISSIELLKEVKSIVDKANFEIVNVDATVIIQSPKIAPYIENMKTNVSTALNISKDRINIKATTEEHLGFTGRGEGVKAEAIALVRKR